MKQIKTLLLVLTVCAFAFSSCTKKSNPAPTVATPGISLKFNGTAYTSSAPVASYSKSLNAIQIIGNFGTTATVYLAIPSGFKVGSFDVASGDVATTFSNGANLQDTYIGVSGTVVITSFTSTTVVGTFNFAATDLNSVTGNITSGQFQANYTNQ
jgi:hypothetical protein